MMKRNWWRSPRPRSSKAAASQARAGCFAALAAGGVAGLAGLAQHLGNEGVAALFGLAGAQAKIFAILLKSH